MAVPEQEPSAGPQSLAGALRSGDPRLAEFLPHPAWSATGLVGRGEQVATWFRRAQPALRRLATGLGEEMRARGADAAGLGAAESLGRAGTLAVLALLPGTPLLGPLSDVLGALGAVALAREAAQRIGRPCVPLVLIAPWGADGGSIYVLERTGGIRRLRAGPGAGPRTAGALLGAAEQATGLQWAAARQLLPRRGPDVFREWNAALATTLLSPLGAVVARADGAALTGALGPLYVRLLSWAATLQAALAASGLAIRAQGFRPPLAPDAATSFFGWRTSGRSRPAPLQGGLPLDAQGQPLSPSQLARLGAERPERFVPERVALYVLLNELLPLLAVVPPDGDLSDWVQLGPALLHTGHGVPLIRPRPRLTVVGAATVAFARARGLNVEGGPEALRQARDREMGERGFDAGRDVAALLAGSESPWALFAEEAVAAAPGLASRLHAERRRWEVRVRRLGADVAAHQRRGNRAVAAAWRTVLNGLYPLDRPQAEVLAAMTFLAGGGERFVQRVLAEPPSPMPRFVRGA